MRKFLILALLVLGLAYQSEASPTFQMLSSPAQVGRYEVFQSTFLLNTVATNYFWPYDTNVPVSIASGVGVSVDAVFTNDSTNTTLTVPCFYFQNYDRKLISGDGSSFSDESVVPNGSPCWMVRFAPPGLGTWHFQLRATDASGSTIYPSGSSFQFNCVSSSNKGFVKVSPTDSRYFELSNGSPIVSVGVNIHPRSTYDSDSILQNLGSNGVKIARWWMSYREWQNPFSGGDYPTNGGPQWEYSLSLSSDGGCNPGDRYSAMLTAGKSTYQNIYLEAGTAYRFTGYIKTSSVSGTGVIPFIGSAQGTPVTGTTGWQAFTVSYTPSSSHVYQVGVRNSGSAGTGYFDNVYLAGKKSTDTDWSSNYMSKGDFDFQCYMDPKEAWKVDHIFQTAKDNGVYLKTVIAEKQDTCLGRINPDGSVGAQADSNFYASSTHPSRWLQKAWWRYIIARWGAYTSAHSWELCNEGDPFSASHYDAANALAGYMKTNDPYGHLVSTSFWHSIPMDFWKNSLCDYIDAHEYFGVATSATVSHGPRFQAWNDPATNAANTSTIPISTSAGQVSYDTTIKHSGNRSLKIISYPASSLSDYNRTTTGSEYHVGANPAHKYTITCWAKGSSITNYGGSRSWEKPRLCITWSRAYHENDWAGESTLDMSLGTYDWQKFQVTGVTPPVSANTANISIEGIRGVPGSANGTLWVDDLVMTDETTGENIIVDGGFEGDRIDYDSALAVQKYGVLLNSYGKRVGKPTMMGETGIRGMNIYGSVYKGLSYTEENQQLVDDTNGVYLKKLIWAHAGPNIPYMMLWWTDCIDSNNLWHYFKALDNFMAGIMVSNGKFKDAGAVTSNSLMRAWGQKDIDDSCAYLWIDNSGNTWKNTVDGNSVAPASGTVTIAGLNNGSYAVEWWDTSTGTITSTDTAQCVSGNLVLNVSNLTSDVACKVYSTASSLPSAPSNLISTSVQSSSIGLSWTDNANNETGYQVQISTDGTSWTNLVDLSADTTTYSVTGLAPLTSYWFQVKACNTNGDSGFSNVLSVATLSGQVAAPSNATAVISKLSADSPTVTINWTDNSNNETGFLIQRAVNGDFSANVQKFYVPANSVSFVDNTVAAATRYKYIIQAYNDSQYSLTFYLKAVLTPGQLPSAPGNIRVSSISSTGMRIDWDSSPITTQYALYRSTAGANGPWQRISYITSPNTYFVNQGLSSNKTYWYMVRSQNTYGMSANSSVVSGTTTQ